MNITRFLSIASLALLASCGTQTRSSMVLQIAGSNTELQLRNTVCEATQNFSIAAAQVRCAGQFSNTTGIGDKIIFEINDAQYIQNNLGASIAVNRNTVLPQVTLGNVIDHVVGGVFQFSDISNQDGGRVCFQFNLLLSSQASLVGSFCDNIAVGSGIF